MNAARKAQLVEGPVSRLLFKLTFPMIFGMFGMVAFNLADTYFVGQLGTLELAAMSFTLPVVMVVSSLALGLGIGTSALVSRAIGEGDHAKVQRLTSDCLSLSLLVVAGAVIVGVSTITPLFRFLGATPDILPLITQYMQVWYLGMIAVVVPMVGNNAIRATGDTTTPSIIMLVAVFVNITLDPLLIFGIGPFSRMELAGAALATVFGRAITLCVAVWILAVRDRMISFRPPPVKMMLDSWRKVLFIGLPAAATNMLLPISAGIVTKLIAAYGPEAVAGFGVATRVEMFALMVVAALSTVLGPFVGQNWGARRYERVLLGITRSQQFSLIWGGIMVLLLALSGRSIAALFTNAPLVISTAATYFWIVPLGYGAQGVLRLSTTTLSVLNKPLHSALFTLIQAFGLYIPCAYLGSRLFGIPGIFSASAMSYAAAALGAALWLRHYVRTAQRQHQ